MNTRCNVKQALRNRLDASEEEDVAVVDAYYVGIVNDDKIAADLKDEIRNLYDIQRESVAKFNYKVTATKQSNPTSKIYKNFANAPLELKFKTFKDKSAIDEYITDPLLGTTEDFPGLCFAIVIDGDRENGYDF